MKNIASLILCLFLTSCATYQAPALPKEQLATLAFEHKRGFISAGSVGLDAIDGKPPTSIPFLVRHRKAIEVGPGKHTLELSLVAYAKNGKAVLWFVAEPGASYIVRSASDGYKYAMWVEDEATGRRVGGIRGSDDEPLRGKLFGPVQ